MKKYLLLPILITAVTACSETFEEGFHKDNAISVRAAEVANAPASDAIDAVKLFTYTTTAYELATAQWDGGFKLKFPEKVSSAYLAPITDARNIPDEAAVEVSDPAALACTGWVEGYLGYEYDRDFYLGKTSGGREYTVGYIYADRRVKVGGVYTTDSDTTKYALSLYRGWNIISVYYENSDLGSYTEYSSSIPAGLGWMYGDIKIK